MPATKSKSHAERKNHFSRRSKNAPKNAKQSFVEDFDVSEMLQWAKEDMAKAAADEKNESHQSEFVEVGYERRMLDLRCTAEIFGKR